jgi:hypothetical protein
MKMKDWWCSQQTTFIKKFRPRQRLSLTEAIHVMTDTSTLEHIKINNNSDTLWPRISPYREFEPPLSVLAGRAYNLRSAHFTGFYYTEDGKGVELPRDLPSLSELLIESADGGVANDIIELESGESVREAVEIPRFRQTESLQVG